MSPYILADDLSGALEAGASFRARGWRVTLPLRPNLIPPTDEAGELQVISTETRNAHPAVARQIVCRTLLEQQAGGARLWFKKVDSTLRGPIGAELLAMIEVLAPRLLVFCPANPEVGRVVVDGKLLVGGVPLAQTDFRNDPAWPATTSDVRELLARQSVPHAAALKLAELRNAPDIAFARCLAEGGLGGRLQTQIVVTDAENLDDLRAVVAAAERTAPSTVFVGSGALGNVLSERTRGPFENAEALAMTASLALVLCGSRHPASHRQLDHLAMLGKARVLTLAADESTESLRDRVIKAFTSSRVVAVRIPSELPSGVSTEPPVNRLADVASSLTTPFDVGVLYLTGGETARSVCGALQGEQLEILRELEPGVVVSRLTGPASGVRVVITKPGGFGGPEAVARHLRNCMK